MLLEVWQFNSQSPTHSIILPDGCRDLIYRKTLGEEPRWFVSPLHDTATGVTTDRPTSMIGYRLRPGVQLEEKALLEERERVDPHSADVTDFLNNFATIDPFAEGVLSGLAESNSNSCSLARRLGVSQRTIQRRLLHSTGKHPLYWMRLARVRRAARLLNQQEGISDVAHSCGYADQSHLTREFKHWFATTPKAFIAQIALVTTASEAGYDGPTGEQISIKKPSGSLM